MGGGAAVVGAACSRGGEGCILIPKMLILFSKSDGLWGGGVQPWSDPRVQGGEGGMYINKE